MEFTVNISVLRRIILLTPFSLSDVLPFSRARVTFHSAKCNFFSLFPIAVSQGVQTLLRVYTRMRVYTYPFLSLFSYLYKENGKHRKQRAWFAYGTRHRDVFVRVAE